MAHPELIFHLDSQRLIKDRAISSALTPLFTWFKRHRITPNMLSYTGFCCHAAAAYFFMDNYLLYAAFFILFLVLDGLDGTYARTSGLASTTGGNVDRLLDGAGALFFYTKAFIRLQHPLVPVVGVLFILNYLLMYALKLESKIGIFRWLPFTGLVGAYMAGLYLDILYFLVFCPARIVYHRFRRQKTA